MSRALAVPVILALLAPGLFAGQVIRKANLRPPPEDAEAERTYLRPLHLETPGGPFGIQAPGRVPHDREVPFFRGDRAQRIWNGPASWGAALPQRRWRPPAPPATRSGELPRPGGDLRARIQQAIRIHRARRYERKVMGIQMLEQYRSEKALLGLCPVDACEVPKLVIEGRPFSPEGYCRKHAAEIHGESRVGWALKAAGHRARWRVDEQRERAANRDKGGRFKGDPRKVGFQGPGARRVALRQTLGQPPLPGDFPRPADLGPNGTVPRFADPRDPAGFPYDTVDPEPPESEDRPARERTTWITQSLAAP